MQYKVFKEVLDKLQKVHDKSSSLYKLGIDLTNCIEDDYSTIIATILSSHYGEEGEDMISLWLYEDVEKVLYESDSNKVIRELKTIKQLWEYVEELRKSPDFKEYELPKKLTEDERMDMLKGMFETKRDLTQLKSTPLSAKNQTKIKRKNRQNN